MSYICILLLVSVAAVHSIDPFAVASSPASPETYHPVKNNDFYKVSDPFVLHNFRCVPNLPYYHSVG